LKTKTLFERCLGRYPIMGFDGDLLALDVGESNGLAPYLAFFGDGPMLREK
jgi:hypothetical protein